MSEKESGNNIERSTVAKYVLTPSYTWYEYIRKRCYTSNLYTCWYKNIMIVDDADGIINSVTVVNALLLTIPFNLLGSYNNDFWSWEMTNLANCNNAYFNTTSLQFSDPNLNITGEKIYLSVSSGIFNCTFSSILGLLLAAIYYSLRPKNQSSFNIWWPRGKYSCMLIIFFTFVAIASLLQIFGPSVSLLLSSTQYSCHAIPDLIKQHDIWLIATILILTIAAILMF